MTGGGVPPARPGARSADLLAAAVLALAGWKFTLGLEHAFDVLLYDESFYLSWGVNLGGAGLPGAGLSPLYAVWYFILSLFEPDRVRLYYLNYKLLTAAPPLLLYALLRAKTVAIPASLTVSWLFLVSRANVETWPKVSHFALALILVALVVVGGARTLPRASLCAAVGALLVSYARPEYFLVYLLCAVLFAGSQLAELRRTRRSDRAGLALFGILSVLLLATFGLPLAGNRSIVAFGQHFSLNWVSWQGSPLNPWTNWKEILSQNFGAARSIPDALAANPAAFLHHVAWNLQAALKRAPPLVFPTGFPFNTLTACAAAASIAGLHLVRRRTLRANLPRCGRWLLFVGCFLLPAFASAVVIYPRDHYVLSLGVLAAAAAAVLLTDRSVERREATPLRVVVLGVLAIALTPSLTRHGDGRHPNLSTIRHLQSLHLDGPVNVLEAEGGYNLYLGENVQRVAEYEKHAGFIGFLAARSIGMIVVSDSLLNDSRFRDDPEWQAFLADPRRFGYRQQEIPGTGRRLIVKNGLLNR